jgi:3-methylcrotonyl-CoA carboxylase alpha subunit
LKKENPGGMKETEFRRILVANRGEIARRIIRAIHAMGKTALVVYADNDRDLPFVSEADEAWSLGSGDLSQTYLHIEGILKIAREARADAIHPGYGFLAENAAFAKACEESGITFIGPSAEMISLMGHKSKAREMAASMGVPVLEGLTGDLDTLLEKRMELPYPLLVKPAAGGGGKGMRIVRSAENFEQEARDAAREALSYFGSGELYVERFLEGPRHIEVQVMADHHGNSVHLFERECSLQRRYQKIVEEAPSPSISEETREHMTTTALRLISELGYANAGTVEFLLDQEQHFYFMEMNTRIQVEHPATELLTGKDLVKEQISIAEGKTLSFSQSDLSMEGHALEVRLYAEDPGQGFLPSTGRLEACEFPRDPDIRIDGGYRAGNLVEPWYDPMLAKLVVIGRDRDEARKKMIQALEKTHLVGPFTNRDFLIALLRSDPYIHNRVHTRYLDLELRELLESMEREKARQPLETLLAAAAFISLQLPEEGTATGAKSGHTASPWDQIGHWRLVPGITLLFEQAKYFIPYRWAGHKDHLWLRIHDRGTDGHQTDGQEIQLVLEGRKEEHYRFRIREKMVELWAHRDRSEIRMDVGGHRFTFRRTDMPDRRHIPLDETTKDQRNGEITAPLNGKVSKIHVKEGDRVSAGEALLVIESMKMENSLLSDHEAIVEQIEVSVGQQVQTNQILIMLASL